MAAAGIILLVFLPRAKRNDDGEDPTPPGPLEALKFSGRLFITKKMLLLIITFFYTGI